MSQPNYCVHLAAWLGLAGAALRLSAGTAFSPDDTRVLVPAFDARTGDMGISIHHRGSNLTEQLFVIGRFEEPAGRERQAVRVRAQWLADGRRVAVLWPGYSDNDDDVMNAALLAPDGHGPTRIFSIPGVADARKHLLFPVPLAGSQLFLAAESNLLVRLNLATGETTHRLLTTSDLALLSVPRGGGLYGFGRDMKNPSQAVLERIHPGSLAQSNTWKMAEKDLGVEYTFGLSPDGSRFALLQGRRDQKTLRLFHGAALEKELPLNFGDEQVVLGLPAFSAQGEVVCASYWSQKPGEDEAKLGLIEISAKDGATRRRPLLRVAEDTDESCLDTFAAEISHDGRTAAFCSTTGLAADAETALKPDQCALFLVDLSNSDRKVTRIPLPLPRKADLKSSK